MLNKILKSENFLSFLGNGIFAAFGFLSIFILARSYSTEVFGEWVLYITGIAFVEMMRTGLSGTPMVRFLSGAIDHDEGKKIIGSGWIINLLVTAIVVVLILFSNFLFKGKIGNSGFSLFFIWYPLLAIIIMPFNFSILYLQSFRKFGPMIILRLVNMGTFLVFLIINFYFLKVEIKIVVLVHMACVALASVIGIILGWSGIRSIFHAQKVWIKKQINFGKFSIGTLIGVNLLKSSDKIILGIMMKSADVALYFIPLKLIEIIEVPIRSFVAVALPRMSKASRQGNNDEVRKLFYSYTGILSIIILPLLLILFFFAEPLVLLLGGKEFIGGATIFRIFLIYAIFLPFDRFLGVTLDSINRPKYNLLKVLLMAIANILGDILVIYLFESLEAVAIITVFNILVGVIIGYYFLKRELMVDIIRIPVIGWRLIINDGLKKIFRR